MTTLIAARSDGEAFEVRSTHADLTRAVAIVNALLPQPPYAAGLRGVRIKPQGDHLSVHATFEGDIRAVHIPGSVSHDRPVFLDGHGLTEALGQQTDADAEVRITLLDRDHAVLWIGAREFPLIAWMDERDPELPSVAPTVTVTSREPFVRAAEQVMVAMPRTPSDPNLTGVEFQAMEGCLRLIATDGFRLARRGVPTITSNHLSHCFVPPSALAGVLEHLTGPVIELGWERKKDGTRFSLVCGDVTVVTSADLGSLPAHARRFPTSALSSVVVNRNDLRERIRCAAEIAAGVSYEHPDSVLLTITPDGTTAIPLPTSTVEPVTAPMTIRTAMMFGQLRRWDIACKWRYLLDALDSIEGDTVTLDVIGASRGTTPQLVFSAGLDDLVKRYELCHLVMPQQYELPAPNKAPRGLDVLRINAPSGELSKAMATASATVDPKARLEPLRAVSVASVADRVTLSGQGLDTLVSFALEATVSAGPAPVILRVNPAHVIAVIEAIGQPDEIATLSAVDAQHPVLTVGGYRVPLMAYDKPTEPSIHVVTEAFLEVDGHVLADVLTRVGDTLTAGEPGFAVTSSVRFERHPTVLVIAATDRYQVLSVPIETKRLLTRPHEGDVVWLDRAMLHTIAQHIDSATVRIGWMQTSHGTYVTLRFGCVMVVSKRTFVDDRRLEQYFPKRSAASITVNREALAGKLRAAREYLEELHVEDDDLRVQVSVTPSAIEVLPVLRGVPCAIQDAVLPAHVVGVADKLVLDGHPTYLERGLGAFRDTAQVTLYVPSDSKTPLVVTSAEDSLTTQTGLRYAAQVTVR